MRAVRVKSCGVADCVADCGSVWHRFEDRTRIAAFAGEMQRWALTRTPSPLCARAGARGGRVRASSVQRRDDLIIGTSWAHGCVARARARSKSSKYLPSREGRERLARCRESPPTFLKRERREVTSLAGGECGHSRGRREMGSPRVCGFRASLSDVVTLTNAPVLPVNPRWPNAPKTDEGAVSALGAAKWSRRAVVLPLVRLGGAAHARIGVRSTARVNDGK